MALFGFIMNTILQQVQQHAASLPLALQAELLNYAIYLEQKARSERDIAPEVSDEQRRKRLAEALEEAAKLNPFGDIADPVAWQREQRQDRCFLNLSLHNPLEEQPHEK
jgi:retron-type reverse transcriptase